MSSRPLDALRYLLVNHVLAPNMDIVCWDADAPSPCETRQQAEQRSLMSRYRIAGRKRSRLPSSAV